MKKNDKSQLIRPSDIRFTGLFDQALRAVESGLFLKVNFRAAADYFRNTLDPFAAGEFWGKLMRAACVVAEYTGSPELRKVVDDAAADMISIQAEDGNISTTPRSAQPKGTHGSDLWERKYVLLGMYAYWEFTGSQDALDCMIRLADYTADQVGAPPKTPITATGWAFYGIESSSILEPIMKLYHLTEKPAYLELARHIVEETGCCAREHMFYAIESGKAPMDIGSNGNPRESIAKAYEMMSCFEGLMEYYRATGDERWLDITKRFVARVCEEEITYLGSGGADAPFNLGPGVGEQWNKTASEQTNPDIHKTMETCVTITYMKMLVQLYRLTADPTLIDRLEVSLYNALIGAMKTDGSYFDYFPKFNGTRSTEVNFSYDLDGMPLSCCTANGPAGLAVLPKIALTTDDEGVLFNLYTGGNAKVGGFGFRMSGNYPFDQLTAIKIESAPTDEKTLKFRIPAWAEGAKITVNGVEYPALPGQYCAVCRAWQAGDEIEIDIPLKPLVHPAPHGSNRLGDPYILVTAGPLVLTRDVRYDENFGQPVSPDGGKFTRIAPPEGSRVCWKMEHDGMAPAILIDYASAGTTWDENSQYASWMHI